MPSAPLPIGAGWWADLEERYATPPRAYHSIEHVRAVLHHWEQVRAARLWGQPNEAWVAVLLHDVIYEPGATDNEERSALLVPEWTRSFDVPVQDDVVQAWIRATAHHGEVRADGDLALFLDCDTAILGAPPEAYDRYVAQVREEYAHLPLEAFQAGRAAFVRHLSSQRIFQSGFFHDRLEAQARANLARELAHLT